MIFQGVLMDIMVLAVVQSVGNVVTTAPVIPSGEYAQTGVRRAGREYSARRVGHHDIFF